MKNTSAAYKQAMQNSRLFRIADTIVFADRTRMELPTDRFASYSINEATSAAGKFEVGAAVIKLYKATIDNSDGAFDGKKFEGADLTSITTLVLPNGQQERIQNGTFRIVSAKKSDVTIQLTAYDSMLFFDKPFRDCDISFPTTVRDLVQRLCMDCGITLDGRSVEHGDFPIAKRPEEDQLTYRDVLSYCAQVMGCYAKINSLDQLMFGWYPFTNLDISGEPSDVSGTYHFFHDLKSQSIDTDDIVVTGVSVSEKKDGKDGFWSMVGQDGYILDIVENPLITADTAGIVASYVGQKIIGKRFRPLSIVCQSNPAIEAGDVAIVRDRKGNLYKTVITNTTFSFGSQNIACTAETPTEKNYTKYSAATRVNGKVREVVNEGLRAYDNAVQNMNQLAANALGFYSTTTTLSDGSYVSYRHDKPKLQDSKIVYKYSIDGFYVTTDYRGSDDATTAAKQWQSGFDRNGNAVLNILSTIGINADWINAGTIKSSLLSSEFKESIADEIADEIADYVAESVSGIDVSRQVTEQISSKLQQTRDAIEAAVAKTYETSAHAAETIQSAKSYAETQAASAKTAANAATDDKLKGYATTTAAQGMASKALTDAIADAAKKADSAKNAAIEDTTTRLRSYYTKSEADARFTVTDERIESVVSKKYVDQSALTEAVGAFNRIYHGRYPDDAKSIENDWVYAQRPDYIGDLFIDSTTGYTYQYSGSQSGLLVTFTDDSHTESERYDYVVFYWYAGSKLCHSKQYGGNLKGQSILIPVREFWVSWYSDGSSEDYGFEFQPITTGSGVYNSSPSIDALPADRYGAAVDVSDIQAIKTAHNYSSNERKLWHYTHPTTVGTSITCSWQRIKDSDITQLDTDLRSQITQTAEAIEASVSGKYVTKQTLTTEISGANAYADTQATAARTAAAADASSKANKALADAQSDTNAKLTSYYTKTEADSKFTMTSSKIEALISNKYETIANVTSKISSAISTAAADATTKANAAKSDANSATDTKLKSYYTKGESDTRFAITKDKIESLVGSTYLKTADLSGHLSEKSSVYRGSASRRSSLSGSWSTAQKEGHVGDLFIEDTGATYQYTQTQRGLLLRFTDDSETEKNADYVEFYWQDGDKYLKTPRYSGSLKGVSVVIPAREFWVYWYTDGSVTRYGIEFQTIATGSAPVEERISASSLPSISGSVTDVSNLTSIKTAHNYGNNERTLWHYTHGSSVTTSSDFSWVRVKDSEFEEVSSRITQLNTSITAEVTKVSNAASAAQSTANTANTSAGNAQTAADAAKKAAADETTRAKAAETTLSSRITQTESSITSEVTRSKKAESDLASRITQTENSIKSVVTAGNVKSYIEQYADSIRLKASKISWKSTNSSMTEDGKLTTKGATIQGDFKTSQNGQRVEIKNGIMYGYDNSALLGVLDLSAKYTGQNKNVALRSMGDLRLHSTQTQYFYSGDNEQMQINTQGVDIKRSGNKATVSGVWKFTEITPSGGEVPSASLTFRYGLLVGVYLNGWTSRT